MYGPCSQRIWCELWPAAGCGKPAYFSEKKPLFEVQTATGLLHNTNGGSAITPIGEADLPTPGYDSSAPIGLNASAKGVKARVFQGGNHWDLHKMLEVTSGSEVSISIPFVFCWKTRFYISSSSCPFLYMLSCRVFPSGNSFRNCEISKYVQGGVQFHKKTLLSRARKEHY